MITKGIIVMLLAIPNLILDIMPKIALNFLPDSWVEGIGNIFSVLFYFFPVFQLLPILIISFILDVAKIAFAVLMRIKSFIPGMGA